MEIINQANAGADPIHINKGKWNIFLEQANMFIIIDKTTIPALITALQTIEKENKQ